MGDSKKEKQSVLSYRPDIEFERKDITGDGDALTEDPSARDTIRQRSAERTNARRHRRIARLNAIDKRLDFLEQKILDNLQDFSITFDPTARPMLAEAVDTLMRSNGPVPSDEREDAALAAQQEEADTETELEDEEIIRTLDEQDEDLSSSQQQSKTDLPPAPETKITTQCYQLASTLMMDSMYHAFGIDPITFGLANTGDGPPMLVPPPDTNPTNCQEMAAMQGVNTAADAELVPADAIVEKKQRKTLMDLFRILWKLLLYFIYGWIIKFLKKLKMHKIPFGVGKKVKKFVKKLKKKRKKILCKITGDCGDSSSDSYVANPADGFETMDVIGNETWSGLDCLTAAKTVMDFVSTQLAFQKAVDVKDEERDPKNDSYGKINGNAHLLPTLNAVMQARDRVEAMKFATILEIPSSEPEFDSEIAELEESSKKKPRYGNRFHTRTGQGWKDLR